MRFTIACLLMTLVVSIFGAAPAMAGSRSLDGRSIFEAVFLQTGRECEAIHVDCSSASPSQRRAVAHLESRIEKTDAGYFAAFESEMTSGDPGLVVKAMRRGLADMRRISPADRVAGISAAAASGATWAVAANIETKTNVTIFIILDVGVVIANPQPQAKSISLLLPKFENESAIAQLTRDLAAR
jgi:SdpC family antimicrobial peptide